MIIFNDSQYKTITYWNPINVPEALLRDTVKALVSPATASLGKKWRRRRNGNFPSWREREAATECDAGQELQYLTESTWKSGDESLVKKMSSAKKRVHILKE